MVEKTLHAIAFPRFSDDQLESLSHCRFTEQKRFRDGEVMFDVGQSDYKFFVVRSGKMEILDRSSTPPKVVRVHDVGEFSGEVAQLTGNPALVAAVALGDCEVYAVSPESLRQILNNHPDMGDTILQAFLARRQLLRESADFAGVRVIGSRHSKDSFRVREFLSKNRMPFAWLDLDGDPAVRELLEQFELGDVDTPVVAFGVKLLRNPTNVELAGQALKPGDRALLCWVSGNLDATEFENPEEVDFGRANKRHMAFGLGPHRCMGSDMVRLEFRFMFEQILSRMPDFRVEEAGLRPSPVPAIVAGYEQVPFVFMPGKKVGGPRTAY
jgi:CRP-like cAMP-binding protein